MTDQSKHARKLMLAIVGVALFSGTSEAHLGDFVYPIFEMPSSQLPDIRDESLEDWEAALPLASLTHESFVSFQGSSVEPEDLAFRVFLGWSYSQQRIYVGVERLDDVLVASHPVEAMQFFVDADHSGGQYGSYRDATGEIDLDREYLQAQMFSLLPTPYDFIDDIQPGYKWTSEPRTAFHSSSLGESPASSVLELWVSPWDDFDHLTGVYASTRLEPDAIIGVQVTMWDLDASGEVVKLYNLVNPVRFEEQRVGGSVFRNFDFAENFADAELVPCSVEDCSRATTVVGTGSWARTKATLRGDSR